MITWSTSEVCKTVPVIQYLTRCQIFLTWVFLLQICCYIPQNIHGNFSLNLQRSCYLTELLTFTVLFNVGVVSEGVSEEFSLTAPMSISDPSNILCIMSQRVSIKRVCMKFKPPGASSALFWFCPLYISQGLSFICDMQSMASKCLFWCNAISLLSVWEIYLGFPPDRATSF